MRVIGFPTTMVQALASVLVGASLVVALGALAATPPAHARPTYARQTGLACGVCHVNPQGGGPRTAFGRAFARNGHHLPGKAGRRRPSSDDSVFERRHYRMDGGMMSPGMMGPGMTGDGGR